MIDVPRRTMLADATHEYLAGMLTNYEYEKRKSEAAAGLNAFDPLLDPMLNHLFYFCFAHGDMDEYRLTHEYKLPIARRREVLRWILFLRSDRNYEWPPFQWISGPLVDLRDSLMSLLTWGYWRKRQRRIADEEFQRFKLAGDYDIWPFIRRSDYEATLAAFCPLYPRV
jgi:hypothetical protein